MTRPASLRAALDAAGIATCGDNSCMFGSTASAESWAWVLAIHLAAAYHPHHEDVRA